MSKKVKWSLSAKFFSTLADEVRDRLQVAGEKGEGVGGTFKAYTPKYAKRKSEGKVFPKDSNQSISSKSTKPDLTLTGAMWAGLTATSKSDSAEVGWLDKSEATKVKGNEENGRAVFTKDKIVKSVQTYIEKQFKREMDKQTAKLQKKPTRLSMKK